MQEVASGAEQALPAGDNNSSHSAPAAEPAASLGPGARPDASAAKLLDTASAPDAKGVPLKT